jgi:pimeloyl-ACP methyl ester carboxylesterase
VREGEATDAAPAQAGDEIYGGLAGHARFLAQPATGGNLRHAQQPGGEQLGLGRGEPGVLGDDPAQHEGAGIVGGLDPVADRGLVGEVAFEDEPGGTVGIVDEGEVRRDRTAHALLVVGGGLECGAQGVEEHGDALVEQGDVQVELAREVLIEDRLAHSGALGDVVHGGSVIALGDEDFARCAEDLGTAFLAGEPGRLRSRCIISHGHAAMLVPERASPGFPWSHSPVMIPRAERWPLSTGEVHVRESGEGSVPTVLVHGLGGSTLNWIPLMERLGDQAAMLAVDLPGFGLSPPPRDGDYSPRGHARTVVATIEEWRRRRAIAGPVHVMGNSMGGAVALQLASQRPDLVSSLTLVSPALPSTRLGRGNAHLPVVAVPGLGEALVRRYAAVPADQRVQATLDACTSDPGRVPASLRDALIAETAYRDSLPYAADAFLRSLRGLLATYADRGPRRPWRLAQQVRQPVLAIYGEDDVLVDARGAARAARDFPDADVALLDDCGHIAQMEHPELVAELWSSKFTRVPIPAE